MMRLWVVVRHEQALQDEATARAEWQSIIQNRTTIFEGLCCKPSDLQEVCVEEQKD